MLTAKQALSDIEKGKARPVYFLYGEEPFKIDEFVEKASAAMFGEGKGARPKDPSDLTFCVDRIDGSASTGSDVLEAIQSMGLFGGSDRRRLVIVRQAQLLKELDALAGAIMEAGREGPWGDNLLLLVAESLDGRRKFHQWLKKQDLVLEFKPARNSELAQWVQYLAKKTGAKVGAEAAQMLAVLSDGSLYRLAQEIEKAWLFAGAEPGLELTVEHIGGVASQQISHEMVELVRAIIEGKRTRALLLSEKLIKGSDDALGLVGFLTWAIKNPGRGGFVGQISGGVARARRLVDALIELDFRLKSTGADPNALVEEFVIEQSRR